MKRALLVGAALWAVAGRGRADSLETSGVGVFERAHEVTVRVAGNVAFLEVTRRFENTARLDDEVTLTIELPASAAVTGLRVGRPGGWHTAVLLDSEAAQERYDNLTGDDASAPAGTPALMSLSGDSVRLQLFRVPAQGDLQIAYSVVAPLAREAGQRQLVFPAGSQPRVLAPRFVRAPLWMFRLLVATMRMLPRFRNWSPAMVERMNRDMVFDHAEAVRDLGFAPRAFVLKREDLPG